MSTSAAGGPPPTTTATTTTTTIASTPIPLSELRSAWRALQAGTYRAPAPAIGAVHDASSQCGAPRNGGGAPAGPAASGAPWPGSPGSSAENRTWKGAPNGAPAASPEWLLPVIGCHGSVGTTTIALALAEAATTGSLDRGRPAARVVEWAETATSGLVGASTRELGELAAPYSGWRYGRRGDVHLHRAQIALDHVGAMPSPPPAARATCAADTTRSSGTDVGIEQPGPGRCGAIDCVGCSSDVESFYLSVLDPGLTVERIAWTEPLLSVQIARAPCVVLVAGATIPSWRRLERTLSCLNDLRGRHPTDPDATEPDATEPRDRYVRTSDQLMARTVLVAVVGLRQRTWPAALVASAGSLTRELLCTQEAIVRIPVSRDLALRGVDSGPLPPPLSRAARRLLERAAAPGGLSAAARVERAERVAGPRRSIRNLS
ncbi:MAG: hypothetical protein WA966_10890 [Ornithinimicrobium sp.]